MTRIVLIGAGKGGIALIELFHEDKTVEIVGVADIDEQAAGLALARKLGIPTTTDYRELLSSDAVDLIIDVTGDSALNREIHTRKPAEAEVLGGPTARFIWELVEAKKQTKALEDNYQLALRELETHAEGEFIIGNNPKMKEIWQQIAKVAPTPTTVLVRGESGTGKELVARAIYRQSALSQKPLVTVNCTALSPALLESELFGHRRGAFTGAYADRIGLFEKADGGTMFLDEIGDMSLETQAKFLRTLQTGEIRVVGDVSTKQVSVRIIAATNRDLDKAIGEGHFREDLFYRINTFSIALPPLRERIEDVPILAECFLQRARAKINKRVEAISPRATAVLKQYAWPGNLREMANIIERAVVLTSSLVIKVEHLPLHVRGEEMTFEPRLGFMDAKSKAVDQFEKHALEEYLREAQGNISRAAQLASLPRRTFHRLMEKHHFAARDFRAPR